MQEQNIDKAQKLHSELQQLLRERRNQSQAAGVAALQRLLPVAQRDTGQSGVVGRFLLGLYNGSAHPFNLTDLRRLDSALHHDCLTVLAMDARPVQEVHEYFAGGDRIWRELAANWGRHSNDD